MRRICEPMGAAEVADFLGVKRTTVHQWQFRGLMPEPSWIVNGAPAWNMNDIIGWAVATDRLDAAEIDDRVEKYDPQPTLRGRV